MKFFGLFKENAIIQRNKPVSVRGLCETTAVCRLQGGAYDVRREIEPDEGKESASAFKTTEGDCEIHA